MNHTSCKYLMSNNINSSEIELFVKEFGQLVKELRTQAIDKQESLAYSIGISTRQLSDIENGKATCRIDTLYKTCNALDLSLSDFFLQLQKLNKKNDELQGIKDE